MSDKESLEDLFMAQRELNKTVAKSKIERLEDKLAKAMEALRFYANRDNWKPHNQVKYSDICDSDIRHGNRLHQCGGLRARKALEELIEKGE